MDGQTRGTVYDVIDLGFDPNVARRAVAATNNVRDDTLPASRGCPASCIFVGRHIVPAYIRGMHRRRGVACHVWLFSLHILELLHQPFGGGRHAAPLAHATPHICASRPHTPSVAFTSAASGESSRPIGWA